MREEELIINAVKKAAPAVVNIVSSKVLNESTTPLLPFGLNAVPFGASFSGQNSVDTKIKRPATLEAPGEPKEVNISGGSGFFISAGGLILTNRHVVQDPEAKYTVITNDDTQYEARVVGRDSLNDVAMLKVEVADAPALELGDSLKLELGQTVMTIGNALGLFQNTVSRGVISGLSRAISAASEISGETSQLRGLIQTDAAINPGNSGGPLVTVDGVAVGINTAVVFGAENIGFAIPINSAKRDLETLKKYGEIVHPSLGIRYVTITKALQERFKLPVDNGAWVVREQHPWDVAVLPGGPAHKAGICENDIIIAFNGKKITEKNALIDFLEQSKIGDTVTLRVLSGTKERAVDILLAKRS